MPRSGLAVLFLVGWGCPGTEQEEAPADLPSERQSGPSVLPEPVQSSGAELPVPPRTEPVAVEASTLVEVLPGLVPLGFSGQGAFAWFTHACGGTCTCGLDVVDLVEDTALHSERQHECYVPEGESLVDLLGQRMGSYGEVLKEHGIREPSTSGLLEPTFRHEGRGYRVTLDPGSLGAGGLVGEERVERSSDLWIAMSSEPDPETGPSSSKRVATIEWSELGPRATPAMAFQAPRVRGVLVSPIETRAAILVAVAEPGFEGHSRVRWSVHGAHLEKGFGP